MGLAWTLVGQSQPNANRYSIIDNSIRKQYSKMGATGSVWVVAIEDALWTSIRGQKLWECTLRTTDSNIPYYLSQRNLNLPGMTLKTWVRRRMPPRYDCFWRNVELEMIHLTIESVRQKTGGKLYPWTYFHVYVLRNDGSVCEAVRRSDECWGVRSVEIVFPYKQG